MQATPRPSKPGTKTIRIVMVVVVRSYPYLRGINRGKPPKQRQSVDSYFHVLIRQQKYQGVWSHENRRKTEEGSCEE